MAEATLSSPIVHAVKALAYLLAFVHMHIVLVLVVYWLPCVLEFGRNSLLIFSMASGRVPAQSIVLDRLWRMIVY
jgi:hypothetical protein